MKEAIINLEYIEDIIKSFEKVSKTIHRAENIVRKSKLNVNGFKVGTKFRLSEGLCHLEDIVDLDAGLDCEIIIYKWWSGNKWEFGRDRLWNLKLRIARNKKGIKGGIK